MMTTVNYLQKLKVKSELTNMIRREILDKIKQEEKITNQREAFEAYRRCNPLSFKRDQYWEIYCDFRDVQSESKYKRKKDKQMSFFH